MDRVDLSAKREALAAARWRRRAEAGCSTRRTRWNYWLTIPSSGLDGHPSGWTMLEVGPAMGRALRGHWLSCDLTHSP